MDDEFQGIPETQLDLLIDIRWAIHRITFQLSNLPDNREPGNVIGRVCLVRFREVIKCIDK